MKTPFPLAAPATGRPAPVRRALVRRVLVCSAMVCPVLIGSAPATRAATTMPPLLDINARCEAAHRKNADAMSECVVAESEARSTILRGWDKVSDAKAASCLKSSLKNARGPYVALAKCLGNDVAEQAPPAAKR